MNPTLDFDEATCSVESPKTDVQEVFDILGCEGFDSGLYSIDMIETGSMDCSGASGPVGSVTREYKLMYTSSLGDIEIFNCTQTLVLEASFPVELSDFRLATKESNVLLDWVISSQVDNEEFIIQRSEDGKRFLNVGEIKGDGTTSNEISYQFIDKGIAYKYNGEMYYRIRQVDYDGQFKDSDVKSIKLGIDDDFKLFPNPTTGNITMSTPDLSNNTIKIFNTMGALVLKINDNSKNEISLSEIEAGIYYLSAETTNGELIGIERFVKIE